MFQNFSTYYNYNHVIREISGKFGIDFSSHKEIINVLKSVTNILGAFQKLKFIPYLEAVLSCIEIGLILLEGIVGKEKSFGYVYKTQDGTEFVWDGGRSQEFFWGLVKNDTLTINDMKLLQPIEINKPQLEDYYYWNKKKYSSTDELKSDQIYWLLNQNNIDMITYPSFKFKYTFDNINDVDNNNSSNNNIVSFDSEENLLEYVKNDINKQNSKYLYKNLFAFSTGQKIENNEQLKEVKINNIIDNIRQTKIIQLPKLFNGFPIAKSAVSPFEYPERSWYNGQIIENSKNYNYIIDNSANALKENKQLSDLIDKTHYLTPAISNAEKKAYNNVIYRFYESFNVESKVVPISELNSKNNYDNMLFYIGNQLLYEVKLPNGIKNYFYYAKDATKWMMSELNFIKYGIYKTETSFIYNNQSFRNEDELIDWIDQKITII